MSKTYSQDSIDYLRLLIPHGKANAITREELCRKLGGINDRAARELIEQARINGVFILNAQNGKGYYQSDDISELEKQYRQDTARALSILKRRKPLRDALKAAGVKV